jgi:Tfp pilus assembly protein PilN
MSVKKITINLHPSSDTKDKQLTKIVAQYFPFVFLGLLVIFVINIILFLVIGSSYLSSKKLSEKWEKLGPDAKMIASLKEEIEGLKKKEKEYQGLVKHGIEMSHVIADIVVSLPTNIWLSTFSYTEGYLKLTGYVVEWKEDFSQSINTFINGLQKNEYFSSVFKQIDPGGRRKEFINKREVMRFEVECRS